MKAKEALLRNFFANVDVVLRQQKVATSVCRWEVRRRAGLGWRDGVVAWLGWDGRDGLALQLGGEGAVGGGGGGWAGLVAWCREGRAGGLAGWGCGLACMLVQRQEHRREAPGGPSRRQG